MEKLKSMKISQKVMALIVLMLVFLGVVGGVGYYFNNKSAKATNELYTSRMASVEAMSKFSNNLTFMLQNALEFMITTDPNRNQFLKNKLEELKASNNQNLKNYEATPLDPYEVERLNRIKEIKPVFRANLTRMEALAGANKNAEAYKVYLANEQLIVEYKKVIEEIVTYNFDEGRKLYEQADRDAAFASSFIIITILAAIAVSGVIGFNMTSMLKRRFDNLVGLANEIASGDFTANRKIEIQDEIGLTGIALINISTTLNKLVKEIQRSVEDVSAGSEEMSASADQTSQGAQQVAISVSQLAGGSQEQANSVNKSLENINSMNNIILKIFKNADNTVELSKSTEDNALNGQNQAESAVGQINQIKVTAIEVSNTINELGKLSADIEQIVDLIKGIASQTNLLALNAAIEAARAGEHGKGFAVVAEEVKKLAGQSAEATNKITEMIKEIQSKTHTAVVNMDEAVREVENGVSTVENTGKALKEILKAAKTTSSEVAEISKEVNNLVNNSDSVVKMMENISAVTEEASASTEEISSIVQEQTASIEEINASSQLLAKIAEGLQKQVSVFKV